MCLKILVYLLFTIIVNLSTENNFLELFFFIIEICL